MEGEGEGEGEGEWEVEVEEVSFVKPETPSIHRNDRPPMLFLSALDLFWRDFHYNRRLLFYRHVPHDFLRTLKASLSRVLVWFYPAAGRLALPDHPDGGGRPVIHCNDAGVEFVEASAAVDLGRLHGLDFPPGPFLNRLARWEHHDLADIYTLPLLSIQATKFKDGGIALGYAHSHVLADGHSMWHFMNSWAECARQEDLSMPPVHMRTMLKVEKPLESLAVLKLPPEDPSSKEQGVGAALPKEPLVEKVYHLSEKMLERLKQRAKSDHVEASSTSLSSTSSFLSSSSLTSISTTLTKTKTIFTTYEVLCAFMWKMITKARELGREEVLRFAILANMRGKLPKPLSNAYFGNAVIFSNSFAIAGEVVEERLGETAMRIREASRGCNEETMWGLIHWLELNGSTFDSRIKSLKAIPTKAVSSPHFPVFQVDFGWGPPIAVRTAKVKGDGEMVLFPPPPHLKGVDICLPLPPKVTLNFLHLFHSHLSTSYARDGPNHLCTS